MYHESADDDSYNILPRTDKIGDALMPAFIANGPDIPENLLEMHEEGKIVFFCGAGISYPAGLPDFNGLVDKIYHELGTQQNPTEEEAYKNKLFDTTLDQLERRYPGQRLAIRKALARVLDISHIEEEFTITHKALIRLATDRDDKVRLVTTNFDRLFQYVINKDKLNITTYSAPLLPIPKKSRWDGIVHLHGLLPDPVNDTELNRLVITSGDFGLAYLTERWAARFVTELFRHYTVCFVGYGINDPVLRYMMDALAADELLGETRLEAFAFASYRNGEKEQEKIKWESKGVVPLLYEVPMDTDDHSTLHRTLKEWADTYRDGVDGKEMIISQHATNPPLNSWKTDYAVGRVLWALTDELAAKRFANLNPVPPLEWLGPLSEKQFGHRDLSRFGVTANSIEYKNLHFSMFHRPAPYTRSPLMCVVSNGIQGSDLDPVMYNLSYWLTRHLNNPKLILWLASYGNLLHNSFLRQISHQLDLLDSLKANDKQDQLSQIIANAPDAVPSPPMRNLWRVFMAGKIKLIKLHSHRFNLSHCIEQIKRDGLTPSWRMELRENLAPRVYLSAPSHLPVNTQVPSESIKIKDLVYWELELASDHVHSLLNGLLQDQDFKKNLPDLLQDSTMLLRDAMDLARELEGADNTNDPSYYSQPSISDHPQNRDHYDWTALIKLARDAWLSTAENDPARARNAAENWWYQSYPVFKRLALFAASNDEVIPHAQALDWLMENSCWCLWSSITKHEAIRLLCSLAPKLSPSEVNKLECAILKGPPRSMLKKDIEDEKWKSIVNEWVWLNLAKFQAAGGKWGEEAINKLDELNQKNPNWKLAKDERDEFPIWIEVHDELHEFSRTPQQCRELAAWLKKHENPDHWKEDDWMQRCRDDFSTTFCALEILAKENKWPDKRWGQALLVWSQDKANNDSWSYLAPILKDAPPETIELLSREISWWLNANSKTFEKCKKCFLDLCTCILELDYQNEGNSDDLVRQAINHPVGLVTDALLQWWYRIMREDDQFLPKELKSTFTAICSSKIDKFRYGRVLLAAHVVTLYSIDSKWTKEFLLPLFDWSSPTEANAVWKGFLLSSRMYRPLLVEIKEPFLEGAKHYEELGEHAEQFATLLTFLALDHGDIFSTEELTIATGCLPIKGLEITARTLVTAFESVRDNRDEYWHNRLLPYIRNVWPKDCNLKTAMISESFALLCLAADELFPEVLEELQYWIKPFQNADILFIHMHEKNICTQFPEEALNFLSLVIRHDGFWILEDFQKCLDAIKQKDQQLASDRRFVNLADLARRNAVR